MNILITGAFGFVGSNLSRSLTEQLNCNLLALDVTEQPGNCYHMFYPWSQLDQIEWDNIDTIIHLAGKAHDTRNTTEEQTYFDINVGLTQKIFEYFLVSKANKFIFFSSVKAVADSVGGDFLAEDDMPLPGTPYGRSKLEAERYLSAQLHDYTRGRGDEGTRGRRHDITTTRLNEKSVILTTKEEVSLV